MSLLGRYAQGLSPESESLQLNVLYTCLKRSVCLTEDNRVCACLRHVCSKASSRDPASKWGPSEFCETPGGRAERHRERDPCHQRLSISNPPLVNLRSSESLQRCMSVLKKWLAQWSAYLLGDKNTGHQLSIQYRAFTQAG